MVAVVERSDRISVCFENGEHRTQYARDWLKELRELEKHG